MPEINLNENRYNQKTSPDQMKMKIWSSAGFMLTYWCPSRCACCYVYSGPEAHSSQTEMSPDLAISCWKAVARLAGERAKIHLTGGEPFGDYSRLRKILQLAQQEQLKGLEKIETNAFWCTDPALVRDRLTELRELGLTKLQVSTDIYHQEYVPIERVRLAVEIAQQVLGPDGIQIRWRDFLERPVLVGALSAQQRLRAFADELAKRKERLLGRAADELAELLPLKPYSKFAPDKCDHTLLGAKHVHIDGRGTVFSGTCMGICVGTVTPAYTLDHLWRDSDYTTHPILSILISLGPYGLSERARPLGFQPCPEYAGKCHLCYHVRRYLFKNKSYNGYLGPDLCYGHGSRKNQSFSQDAT